MASIAPHSRHRREAQPERGAGAVYPRAVPNAVAVSGGLCPFNPDNNAAGQYCRVDRAWGTMSPGLQANLPPSAPHHAAIGAVFALVPGPEFGQREHLATACAAFPGTARPQVAGGRDRRGPRGGKRRRRGRRLCHQAALPSGLRAVGPFPCRQGSRRFQPETSAVILFRIVPAPTRVLPEKIASCDAAGPFSHWMHHEVRPACQPVFACAPLSFLKRLPASSLNAPWPVR